MKTKAKCEAVADIVGPGRTKIGEEVRFYVDGVLVQTLREDHADRFGGYVVGEEYDVDVPAVVPDAETGPSRERWATRPGAEHVKPMDLGNASSRSSSPSEAWRAAEAEAAERETGG